MKKSKMRLLAWVITLAIFIGTLPVTAFSVSAASGVWNGTEATGFASGTGTESDLYIIGTAEQLAYFASSVNSGTSYSGKYIKLANDIVLNNTSNWEDWGTTAPANSWTAIGGYIPIPYAITSSSAFNAAKSEYGVDHLYYKTSSGSYYSCSSFDSSYSEYYVWCYFGGTFDGDGHTVSGIYINTENDYQGLFGYVHKGTIKNLGIEKSYIKGGNEVGGVVGENYGGTVTNCYNTGTVNGNEEVGGVLGNINYERSTITDCYYLSGCAKDGNGTVQFGIGNEIQGDTTADVSGKTTGLTDEQMKQKESFKNWDFDTVWDIKSTINNGYPHLRAFTYEETAHTHEFTAIVTKPTCTENGYTTYTCTCGDSYVGDYKDALGHNFVNDICSRCGTEDSSVIIRGECGENGDNVTWTLYKPTGVLTISGTGNMADYARSADVPWCGCTSEIKTVNIENGVTSIGNYAFYNCAGLASITIPNSVTSIGNYAFYGCEKLTIYCDKDSYAKAYAINNGINYDDRASRIKLADEDVSLSSYIFYYKGFAVEPEVILCHGGITYNAAEQLSITYSNNNSVGKGTVTVEGIDDFYGTVILQFDICYETVPSVIQNVVALSEIAKISVSYGRAKEVNTVKYNIYRSDSIDGEFKLITTVNGRDKLNFTDTAVQKGSTYYYYVTGVDIYGAEGEPSEIVTAAALIDTDAPIITMLFPVSSDTITKTVKLSAVCNDNVGVTKVNYYYLESSDNPAGLCEFDELSDEFIYIGTGTSSDFSVYFDTLKAGLYCDVTIVSIAYDAEGNMSEQYIQKYSVDNTGPDEVTGISADVSDTKAVLSWKRVDADDASSFILYVSENGGAYKKTASDIKKLGYILNGLAPGARYSVKVSCVDIYGNEGVLSEPYEFVTAIDEQAPYITSQSPSAGRYNNSINYTVKANDNSDVASITIQLSLDGKSWSDISTKQFTGKSTSQSYTYKVSLSGYNDGIIYLRGIAADRYGNISDTSDKAPFTQYYVDTTSPEAPVNVAAYGRDGYILVSWTQGIELDLGGYNLYRSTSENGTYTLIASNLKALNYADRNISADNVYYYRLTVSDTCGNTSGYSSIVSAKMSDDSIAPFITGISRTSDQKISTDYNTIYVSASDNNKLSSVIVEIATLNDTQYKLLKRFDNLTASGVSEEIIIPLDGLTDGDIVYIRAYAIDAAGLVSDYAAQTYIVDLTPPDAANLKADVQKENVHLSWNDGNFNDIAGYKIYRGTENNGNMDYTQIGTRKVSSNGSYTFIDVLPVNISCKYTYKVVAVDIAGNADDGVTVEVDYVYVYENTPPVAVIDSISYMTVDTEELFDATNSTDNKYISSYYWDFGDGTNSYSATPVKSYANEGEYTITLTVTDNEGASNTVSKVISVKKAEALGTLKVRVIDEYNKSISGAPVYFDLGTEAQTVIYTDYSGYATLKLSNGNHTIGVYNKDYLPVKTNTVVLANSERTVTLKTAKQEIVTGKFEIKRMTFEEIVDAGIDVHNVANQNFYKADVVFRYSDKDPEIKFSYIRNNGTVIMKSFSNTGGTTTGTIQSLIVRDSNNNERQLSVAYISGNNEGDIIAILDVPVGASYLKEFFDVKLYIINNASSDFVLTNNCITLNVPAGLSIAESLTNGYYTDTVVNIPSIRGQETKTLAWVIRGDSAGEYTLSADYSGTISDFNELVTARFIADETIKVYGLEGVKFRILASDEINANAFYFKVELENQRDIDIYMPSVALPEYVYNVFDDKRTTPYLLNAYIEDSVGNKIYIPVDYDSDGNPISNIDTLINNIDKTDFANGDKSLSDVVKAIKSAAENCKTQLESEKTENGSEWNHICELLSDSALEGVSTILETGIEKLLSANLYKIIKAGFNTTSKLLQIEDYIKSVKSIQVYSAISSALVKTFDEAVKSGNRTAESDLFAMITLKNICELRLDSEAEFKDFIADKIAGKYFGAAAITAVKTSIESYISELFGDGRSFEDVYNEMKEERINLLNKIKGSNYSDVDEWYDDCLNEIASARNILFNEEIIDDYKAPAAPTVTIDYYSMSTAQAFSDKYEYCFGDGVWKKCSGDVISFVPKDVPSVLRVRKAATETNMAGEITSVVIYSQRELSKLIEVKFDGYGYEVANLSPDYYYQISFINSKSEVLNAENTVLVKGDSKVNVFGFNGFKYAVITACINDEKCEMQSLPLCVDVQRKYHFNIVYNGSGSVTGFTDDAYYFDHETVYLTALPDTGYEFVGWYINGKKVSENPYYIYEINHEDALEAKFTGVSPVCLNVVSKPNTLVYFEDELVNKEGMVVTVTMSDGTTKVINDYRLFVPELKVGVCEAVVEYAGLIEKFNVTYKHKMSENWTVLLESTCKRAGLEVRICECCGTREYRTVPMLSHTYKTVWSIDATNHWHECSVCGDITDLEAHIYDNACDTTCNICGYVRTDVKKVKRLSIYKMPTFRKCFVNQDYLAEGLTIKLINSDNSTTITDDFTFYLDTSTAGQKNATMSCHGIVFTLEVEVVSPNVNHLAEMIKILVGREDIENDIDYDIDGDRAISILDLVRMKKMLASMVEYNPKITSTSLGESVGISYGCNGDNQVNDIYDYKNDNIIPTYEEKNKILSNASKP